VTLLVLLDVTIIVPHSVILSSNSIHLRDRKTASIFAQMRNVPQGSLEFISGTYASNSRVALSVHCLGLGRGNTSLISLDSSCATTSRLALGPSQPLCNGFPCCFLRG